MGFPGAKLIMIAMRGSVALKSYYAEYNIPSDKRVFQDSHVMEVTGLNADNGGVQSEGHYVGYDDLICSCTYICFRLKSNKVFTYSLFSNFESSTVIKTL